MACSDGMPAERDCGGAALDGGIAPTEQYCDRAFVGTYAALTELLLRDTVEGRLQCGALRTLLRNLVPKTFVCMINEKRQVGL